MTPVEVQNGAMILEVLEVSERKRNYRLSAKTDEEGWWWNFKISAASAPREHQAKDKMEGRRHGRPGALSALHESRML